MTMEWMTIQVGDGTTNEAGPTGHMDGECPDCGSEVHYAVWDGPEGVCPRGCGVWVWIEAGVWGWLWFPGTNALSQTHEPLEDGMCSCIERDTYPPAGSKHGVGGYYAA